VLEVVYLIAGNLCIRMGVIENAFNSMPEADFVSWESGTTYLPGLFSFEGFTYRGQTLGGQTYFHLSKLDAHISLRRLLFKRLVVRGLRARDLDYRHRDRIDFPCWSGASGEPFPGTPANIEYYPEIPGLENPPNPKPEELYPQKEESKPWRIEISGARIKGSVRVAYNAIRLEGRGLVGGGMTAVLKETTAIDRGKVRVVPATLVWGPKVVTDNLDLDIDIAVAPFPSECAEMPEILSGLSGRLHVSGKDADGFTFNVGALEPLLPGQGLLSIESGTGELGGLMEVGEGEVSSGRLDLVADDVVLKRQDVTLHGDLEVHASLSEGNLATRRFDVSGTIFRLDDIAKMASSTKKQQKYDPWYGHLEFEKGTVTFGKPMSLDSQVRLTMHDTRPFVALVRKGTDRGLKWLSLTRNVKGLAGTMELDFGKGFVAVDDLNLTGEDVEILGWLHIRDQKKNGRIFARHGARAVGVAFDEGKGKVVTTRPRRWFDKQTSPQVNGDRRHLRENEPK
jgi:hypothetical protein